MVHTEIEIAASPTAVWNVLADLKRWSEWNHLMLGLALRGPLREGTRGRLTLQLPPPVGPRTIAVRLVATRTGRELTWEGGLRRVVFGRHGFVLTPTDRGTRVVHFETFSGLLVPPLLALVHARLSKDYHRVNQGLRDYCETI